MARTHRPEHKKHQHHKGKDHDKGKGKGKGDGKDGKGKGDGSATGDIKETTTTGECPVITMSPTAQALSVPPDASAEDPSVWSTGPGEAVMYHYERQGQYAEEFASQQAEQSAVPAGVSVAGPGGG